MLIFYIHRIFLWIADRIIWTGNKIINNKSRMAYARMNRSKEWRGCVYECALCIALNALIFGQLSCRSCQFDLSVRLKRKRICRTIDCVEDHLIYARLLWHTHIYAHTNTHARIHTYRLTNAVNFNQCIFGWSKSLLLILLLAQLINVNIRGETFVDDFSEARRD